MPAKEINGVRLVTQQEIANEFGITTSAIRKYEDKGLIQPAETTKQGSLSYKWYDDKTIFRIRLIRMYVEMGESLDRVKQILSDPNFDSAAEINRLRKRLLREKARISRQIAFCDMVGLYGVKIATLLTTNEKSAESYMGKVMKQIKAAGLVDRIKSMKAESTYSQLDELDKIVYSINELSHLSYTDNQVQSRVNELIDKWTEFEIGSQGLAGNPRLGYRLSFLLSGLLISLGDGTFTSTWRQKVGQTGVGYLSRAFVYGMMKTVFELIEPFSAEYRTLSLEEEKSKLIDRMYDRLSTWLASTILETNLTEDETKDILQDLVEETDSSLLCEEECDDLYESIVEELRQLD